MASLVIAEHDNVSLKDATHKSVTAAAAVSSPVHILVAGENCAAVADAAAKIAGVGKVLLADSYDAILAPATTTGKNILPRVAAKLDTPQISEILKVISPDTFERPIYAGNAVETLQAPEGKKIITVRTTAFKAAVEGGSAVIEKISAASDPGLSKFVSEALSKSERPELTSAKTIVSAGRGLGSGENFKLLDSIADKLHAAIGASRAAVDAGYAPNDYQVGQTGKVVAPELYIADEEAPIFQVADYGLVADLFKTLPEIDEELSKRGYK